MMVKSLASQQRKNNLFSFISGCDVTFLCNLHLCNRPRLRYTCLSPFIVYCISQPALSNEKMAQQSVAVYLEPIPVGGVYCCSQFGIGSGQQLALIGSP